MKKILVLAVMLAGVFPSSSADAVPIDAAVKKCLEKSVGKSATRSIERAKKLTAKQQRSVDACGDVVHLLEAAPGVDGDAAGPPEELERRLVR